MTSSVSYQSTLHNLRRYAPAQRKPASAFPWLFFVVTWIILFAYQNDLTPNWQDSVQLSDVVNTARTGDIVHQGLVILLGILGIVSFVRYGRGLRIRGAVGVILLVFITWIGLSVIWSDDMDVTFRRQIAFGLMLVFCAGCAARMSRDCLALFVTGLAALNAVAGLVQEAYRGTLHPFAADSRFAGTVSPNIQGASLSLAVIVAFWCAWRYHGIIRHIVLCGGIVLFVLILMTGSRTSLLGLAVAVIASIVLIQIREHRNAPSLIAAIVMLVLGLVAAAALVRATGLRPLEGTDIANLIRTDRDVGEVTDLTGRNVVWEICLRYAAERPISGFGYGGFWTATRLNAVADELKWPVFHGHSAYLDTLLQLGVPGATLYVLLLFAGIVTCVFQFARNDDGAGPWAVLLVFIAVNGLTESIVVLPTFPGFVMNLLLMTLALKPTD